MEFRPCIDIHNGKVKQIVGSTLNDEGDSAVENFVSHRGSLYFATLYRDNGIKGGHVILLNKAGSPFFEDTYNCALEALKAYPGGLQIGGGINDTNAAGFIEAGASHVIVTSYLFENGRLSRDRMKKLESAVGRKCIVFDLSCIKREDGYHIATDRWQTVTDEILNAGLLEELDDYCDEFLIHAVDVEGKNSGIEKELVEMLAGYEGNAVTYAGGVRSFEDIEVLRTSGKSRINFTIGSALDIFGGNLKFEEVVSYMKKDR